MPNGRARKATKARTAPTRVSQHTLNVLRRAGIKYKVTTRGRTTVLGKGRPPKQVFPKARFKILRRITY